uniref:DNA/RNA-binding protein Alba-like domain-containing protein n=1 Tax=Lactuca sativa TaxID=4236 RepID=A0A9R1VNH4_LACSA|nr:hypothetical protein LSAT_V11C400186630 [Lactuca sativa]
MRASHGVMMMQRRVDAELNKEVEQWNYITYAITLVQEKGADEISLKAMGRAINKTVMIAKLIKDCWSSSNYIYWFCRYNIYVGTTRRRLSPLETTRHVSVITITLSRKELDTSSIGYQQPIPADLVKPFMAHLTCVEEAVVVEGVEVEEIITMEGLSTMEMVGGKMGKDMVVDGMTGVVLVEEGGDEEEVVAVTVDVVVPRE